MPVWLTVLLLLSAADVGLQSTPRTSQTAPSASPGSRNEYLPPVEENIDVPCGINIPSPSPNKEHVHIGEYPWMALIGYDSKKKPGRTVFNCAGTLINKLYVVTAAHCVRLLPKGLTVTSVRLGDYNITSDVDCGMGERPTAIARLTVLVGSKRLCAEPVQDYAVGEIVPHPDHHRPKRYRNDIALVRLERPVEVNDFVRPICLPFGKLPRRVTGSSTLTIAGYGAVRGHIDQVRELILPIVKNIKCNIVFRKYRSEIGDSQLCAGGQKGRGACSGDAGGPLMSRAPGPFYLIGVVSFGAARCGTKDVPDVYTKVSEYEEWIKANMRN